jgi:hypothetical protein
MNRACNIRQVLAVKGHCHGIEGRLTYEKVYYPTLLVLVLESIGLLEIYKPLSTSTQVDLLYSLERICYKIPDPVPIGRRHAVIRVGESVNLAQWLEHYRADKHRVANQIVKTLQSSVMSRLTVKSGYIDPSFTPHFGPANINLATENSPDPAPH